MLDSSPAALSIATSKALASAPAVSTQHARIAALDFTKGVLVLVMVLYHWLNYFVGAQGTFYRYLSFLPPSFICISGFLVAHVYLARNQERASRIKTRLAMRGLKILGIFLALNAAIRLLLSCSNPACEISASSLFSIFVSGNMTNGRFVAFYVLVPISYLLLLSAALLLVSRSNKQIFLAATVLLIVGVAAAQTHGVPSANLELLTMGFIGASLGFVPLDKINRAADQGALLVFLYLAQVAAITRWNTPFPLQLSGVLLTLLLIYRAGAAGEGAWWPQRVLMTVGRYSLFGYIIQIAILQVVSRVALHLPGLGAGAWLLPALLLTVGSIALVDRLRIKSQLVDGLYRAVFA